MSTGAQPAQALPNIAPSAETEWTTSDATFVPLLRSALLGVGFTNRHKVQDCVTSTLKKRLGSRQVLSFRFVLDDLLTGKQSLVELIGKRYSEPAGPNAIGEFQAMQMLWKEGFGNDPRFKIPRPMRHFEEARLLLEERACGLEFSKYMGRNNRVSRAHARMAGLWLAKLHNLKSAPPGFCTYDAECFALGIFTKELCTALSSLAPQLQEIAKAIRGEFESFREAPVAWVHGDFHPQNILVAQGQVTVIDFDRFCLADPAKDVGSFIAHMRTMACCSGKSLEAVNQEIRAFGDAYLGAASTETAARLEKRVATFVVFSCLEALHYVACVMKVTNADLIGRYLHCAQEAQIERTATWKTWESGAAKPQCP